MPQQSSGKRLRLDSDNRMEALKALKTYLIGKLESDDLPATAIAGIVKQLREVNEDLMAAGSTPQRGVADDIAIRRAKRQEEERASNRKPTTKDRAS